MVFILLSCEGGSDLPDHVVCLKVVLKPACRSPSLGSTAQLDPPFFFGVNPAYLVDQLGRLGRVRQGLFDQFLGVGAAVAISFQSDNVVKGRSVYAQNGSIRESPINIDPLVNLGRIPAGKTRNI